MAANELEQLARALLAGQPGQKGTANMEQLGALLKTEDGKRLLTLLSQGGADSLKTAAQAALRGDERSARAAMLSILNTKEGAELAKKIAPLLQQGKKR